MHNPVTHYRWLIVRGADQEWLTGAGRAAYDVPDSADFRLSAHPSAPDWARDGVVYQVFPDRFARSAAADDREVPDWALPAEWDDEVVFEGSDPRTPMQLYGGDLDGIYVGSVMLPFLGTMLLLLLLAGLAGLLLWRAGRLALPALGGRSSAPEEEARRILAERFAHGDITTDEFLERSSILNWTPGSDTMPDQHGRRRP